MSNGKGSKERPMDHKKYKDNYDSIFNKEDATFHESKKFSSDDVQVALVDIDETVCAYGEKRRYDLAVPIKKNIDKINKMYDDGWYIIYWTARGGSEKSKKAGRCYYDFTWNQLESWGCKFHELSTGSKGNYIKPACDIVIDDKAKRIEEI
tara:strand:+ start:1180 stop:1632 length:453 start_codon:yes stop_codon:yes gene_type:complete